MMNVFVEQPRPGLFISPLSVYFLHRIFLPTTHYPALALITTLVIAITRVVNLGWILISNLGVSLSLNWIRVIACSQIILLIGTMCEYIYIYTYVYIYNKNPAYARHQISLPMRIEASIFSLLKNKQFNPEQLPFLGLYELVHKCTSPHVDVPRLQSGTTPCF